MNMYKKCIAIVAICALCLNITYIAYAQTATSTVGSGSTKEQVDFTEFETIRIPEKLPKGTVVREFPKEDGVEYAIMGGHDKDKFIMSGNLLLTTKSLSYDANQSSEYDGLYDVLIKKTVRGKINMANIKTVLDYNHSQTQNSYTATDDVVMENRKVRSTGPDNMMLGLTKDGKLLHLSLESIRSIFGERIEGMYGDDSGYIYKRDHNDDKKIIKVNANEGAFYACAEDGENIAFGKKGYSTYGDGLGNAGCKSIASNEEAFAVVDENGKLNTLGYKGYGGSYSSTVDDMVFSDVIATSYGFSVLKKDGNIEQWSWDAREEKANINTYKIDGKVKKIIANKGAYAALTENGNIKVRGRSVNGGSNQSGSYLDRNETYSGAPDGTDFASIYANNHSFAALTNDGKIYARGWNRLGGDQTQVPVGTGFTDIKSTEAAYAALNLNGEIKVRGDNERGGDQAEVPTGTGFTKIYANQKAFAALSKNGEIKVRGDNERGGDQAEVPTGTGFVEIYPYEEGFLALTKYGKVKAWGYGISRNFIGGPKDAGYTKIYAKKSIFIATKDDGTTYCRSEDRDYNGKCMKESYQKNITVDLIPQKKTKIEFTEKQPKNAVVLELPDLSGDKNSKYTLEVGEDGVDYRHFILSGNKLIVKNKLLYDDPIDKNKDNIYHVKIKKQNTINLSGATFPLDFDDAYNNIDGGRYAAPYWPHGNSFSAIREDGSIFCYGGGYCDNVPQGTGFVKIYSNRDAFAALTQDGEIKVWGYDYEGVCDNKVPTGTGFIEIYGSRNAFAALTQDGAIESRGCYVGQNNVPQGTGFGKIYHTNYAFAALTQDGEIKSWGNVDQNNIPTGKGFTDISTNSCAFAALTKDGEIKVWGRGGLDVSSSDGSHQSYSCKDFGGDQKKVPQGTGFTKIYSTEYAFAALTQDGEIKTWGMKDGIPMRPMGEVPQGTGFTKIYAHKQAFATLTKDGEIRSWGSVYQPTIPKGNDFVNIYANDNAFAALTKYGEIKTWGFYGASKGKEDMPDGQGFERIYGNSNGFLTLTKRGAIRMRGNQHIEPEDKQIDNFVDLHVAGSRILAIKKNGDVYHKGQSGRRYNENIMPIKEYKVESFDIQIVPKKIDLKVEPQKTIYEGNAFDPMKLVIDATDKDRNNVKNKVIITDYDGFKQNSPSVGMYDIVYLLVTNSESISKKATITVIDKNKDLSSLDIIPTKTITQGENLNLRDLITKAIDEDGNDVTNKVKIVSGTYKNTVIGDHVVTYSLSRDGKEPLTKTATITVKKKQTTPTLKPTLVVHNTEMTQGDNLDLRSLIDQATYTNGTDARAVVTVNSVGFDPNSPGVYTITYVLQEGNIFTQAKATVTVHKKSVNPNPNPNPNPGETMTAEKARIIAQNSVCKDKGTLIKDPFDGVAWRSFTIRTSQGHMYCRIDKKSKKVSIEGHGTGALIEPTLTVKRTATVVKGSSFDPRSLITKAVDQKGKDMTSEVIIDTDGLDTQKIGAYTVKYRLRVDGKLLRAESYIAVVEKSTTDPDNNGTGSTKTFTTQYSLTDSKIFKKNDCPLGTFPSAVNYVSTATKIRTAATEKQADALAKQAAEIAVMKDILANGQIYANTHGKCTQKAQVGIIGLPHTGAER